MHAFRDGERFNAHRDSFIINFDTIIFWFVVINLGGQFSDPVIGWLRPEKVVTQGESFQLFPMHVSTNSCFSIQNERRNMDAMHISYFDSLATSLNALAIRRTVERRRNLTELMV